MTKGSGEQPRVPLGEGRGTLEDGKYRCSDWRDRLHVALRIVIHGNESLQFKA